MKLFDTYGFFSENIRQIKEKFEDLTDLQLQPRFSSYKGEYYFNGKVGEENYILQKNFCESEGLAEEEYPEMKTILYVSYAHNADYLRISLLDHYGREEINHIERIVITEDGWYRKYVFEENKDKLVIERRTLK